MSHEMIESLLRSGKVIIPYEDIQGGRQVSTLVSFLDGLYGAFDLFDDDSKYLGPIGLRQSRLSSQQIEAWINSQDACYETIALKAIHVTKADFLLDGAHASVIEAIDLFGVEGDVLQLRREGAAYPYGLVLETVLSNALDEVVAE